MAARSIWKSGWSATAIAALCVVAATGALAQGPDGMEAGARPAQRMGGMPGQGMPGMAPQMVAVGDRVYILRGNRLTQYGAADLAQIKSVQIEFERVGIGRGQGAMRGGGRPEGLPEGGPGLQMGAPGQRGSGQDGTDGAPEGAPGMMPGAPGDGPGPDGPDGAGQPGGFAPGQGGPGGGGEQRGPGMSSGMPGMPGGGPGMRMAPASTLAATSEYVYVLHGRTLYQYSAKGLSLIKKVTIAELAPQGGPMGGAGGGGNRPSAGDR